MPVHGDLVRYGRSHYVNGQWQATQNLLGYLVTGLAMLDTINAPRQDLSPYAPRIISIKINPEVIGKDVTACFRSMADEGTYNVYVAIKGEAHDGHAFCAAAVAFVPRRKSILQLAALTAAVLIGFELVLTHWFYLYIPWFFPFVAFAVLYRRDPSASVH